VLWRKEGKGNDRFSLPRKKKKRGGKNSSHFFPILRKEKGNAKREKCTPFKERPQVLSPCLRLLFQGKREEEKKKRWEQEGPP